MERGILPEMEPAEKLRVSFHPDYIQHTCSWGNMPKALLEMQDLITVQGENQLHLSSKFFPPPWYIISQEKQRIFKESDSLKPQESETIVIFNYVVILAMPHHNDGQN